MAATETHVDLAGRHILLGVTGGIAAYKAVELVRLLKKAGADVQVVMTHDAERFIPRLTLGTVSEHPILVDVFPEAEEGSWTKHITLGRWADLFVIAPATAQTIAKLAGGFCDNMLTAVALAIRCPVLICPAMDHDMFVHPATKENLDRLASYGHRIMPPAYGELASGLVGQGRLPEPAEIVERVAEILSERSEADATLRGRKVVVTAGPTRERLDPVRFISNPSSGKMGYALAAVAARRGADVTLVSGPTQLDDPQGVDRVDVGSASEMHAAVMDRRDADFIVMAAAVADYAPAETADHKIKKSGGELTLRLQRTKDILAELGQVKREGQVLVGFAMETENAVENARRKLEAKHLDWIVLNRLNEEGAGFQVDTNRVMLIRRGGSEEELPMMSKQRVAEAIWDRIAPPPSRPAA